MRPPERPEWRCLIRAATVRERSSRVVRFLTVAARTCCDRPPINRVPDSSPDRQEKHRPDSVGVAIFSGATIALLECGGLDAAFAPGGAVFRRSRRVRSKPDFGSRARTLRVKPKRCRATALQNWPAPEKIATPDSVKFPTARFNSGQNSSCSNQNMRVSYSLSVTCFSIKSTSPFTAGVQVRSLRGQSCSRPPDALRPRNLFPP